MPGSAKLNLVLTAGGTGGHLFPALALAQEFRRQVGAQISFITAPRKVTLDILQQYDFPFQVVRTQALKGVGWGRRLASLVQLPLGYWQAGRILRRLQPDLVIGMGGYVSGPAGLAAWRQGLPLVLHEQNAVMGSTNRYLGRLAAKIFLTFPETEANPAPQRSIWSGNPVRPEFTTVAAPLRPARPFTVLVMGGSQGARQLNRQMVTALPLLQEVRGKIQLIHLTGAADYDQVWAAYQEAAFPAEVYSFSPRVADFMHRAHLVICRAGASTLAELLACGRVGLLVPYPYAANQHQEKNARYLVAAGAAFHLPDQELTGEKIAAMIKQSIAAPQELLAMEEQCRRLSRPQAAGVIVAECLKLLADRRGES